MPPYYKQSFKTPFAVRLACMYNFVQTHLGAWGSVVVKALCY
jgi:hypothetical protein